MLRFSTTCNPDPIEASSTTGLQKQKDATVFFIFIFSLAIRRHLHNNSFFFSWISKCISHNKNGYKTIFLALLSNKIEIQKSKHVIVRLKRIFCFCFDSNYCNKKEKKIKKSELKNFNLENRNRNSRPKLIILNALGWKKNCYFIRLKGNFVKFKLNYCHLLLLKKQQLWE